MSRNKSIQISVILILSLFLTSFTVIDGIHSAGSDENAAPWMPVTNTPTETTIPTYTEIPTETATQTFTEEPTATETPSISTTPTFTETLPVTDTPTLTPTQIQTITETPTVTPTATETSSQTCVGLGTYDDSDANITYSTGWTSQTLSGAYNNTEHYSSTIGSTAALCVTLPKTSTISIIYRAHPGFGTTNISIDGNGVDYDASIDQNASNQILLDRWDSLVLTEGTYTVGITHESGSYITLDAIIINDPVDDDDGDDGTGIFNDDNPYIFYSTGWNTQAVAGNYSDDEHYSFSSGSAAYLTFNLSAPGNVYVYYRTNPNFGVLTASIDDVYGYRIDQLPNSSYTGKWKSALLSAGVHTLKLSHFSGVAVIIDAIEVDSSPDLNNFHDDADYEITYSTGWYPQYLLNAYQNTEHYSTTIGSTASYSLEISEQTTIALIYRSSADFGDMGISIDNQTPIIASQYAESGALLQRWDSPALSAGTHTIVITHESGSYITLDAIIINDPVDDDDGDDGTGIFNDDNPHIFYSTGWNTQAVAGNYSDDEHYSFSSGSAAYLTFNLSAPGNVYVYYRTNPNFGVLTASIDDVYGYHIDQLPNSSYPGKWKSALLSAGVHTLKLSHFSGAAVVIDAIELDSPTDLSNIHDDADFEISYSDGWLPHDMLNAYENTEHYSATIGSTASYSFETTEQTTIALIYRSNPGFGDMSISIDNQTTPTIISQSAESGALKQRWDSPILAIGNHSIVITTHESDSYITLDAIIVNDPVGDGIYDDRDSNIFYSPGWATQAVAGVYLTTESYSTIIGSSATLTFDLTNENENIIVQYRSYPTLLGEMEIYIDGNLIDTINQYSSTQILVNQWVSPDLTSGVHTLTLKHVSNTYVTLDAIYVNQ